MCSPLTEQVLDTMHSVKPANYVRDWGTKPAACFFFFLKEGFFDMYWVLWYFFLCNMLSHLILIMTQWGRYNHLRISSKKKERIRVRSRGLGEDWQNWSFWIHLFLPFSSYLPFLWCVYSALPWILWVNRVPSWTGGGGGGDFIETPPSSLLAIV